MTGRRPVPGGGPARRLDGSPAPGGGRPGASDGRAPAVAAAPEPMRIRSVRLPDALWERLEAARAEAARRADAARGRRRPVPVASVIRALLEHGLERPGDALDLHAKAIRPAGVLRRRAEDLAATRAAAQARDLFTRASEAVDRLRLTPLEFARRVGGNRRDAEKFYFSGALPEGDPRPLLDRVGEWLAASAPGPAAGAPGGDTREADGAGERPGPRRRGRP